eukprot:TRINITY_DN107_c3_g1_i1.p1 TRINITY_DN107_c3_g1~~TRINITY_DN107_c3_g1_i1.p1  ORF type:complete len:425 (-),score=182.35 TRINITY_DN107_c3_g1_i1:50-1324(-)
MSLFSQFKRVNKINFFHFKQYSTSSEKSYLNLKSILNTQIEQIKEAGTFKNERIITSPQSSQIFVKGSNQSVLNFCANNYLGLADKARLVKAAEKSMQDFGFGLASVRFICGTQTIHKQLEQRLSEFHGTEDTILYSSCFDANAGIFEALLGPEDAVFSDSLNHASIIDGVRLCKAEKYRYQHFDWNDLENKLKEAEKARVKLIVTDGVFSMDGDIAPLTTICDIAEKYGAIVMIDECHATGFMGKTGKGTPEYHNVMDRIHIINSTLGKALGGASGGYTTGKKEIIDILRQRSRPYLFSNSVAPPLVGATIEVLNILTESTELRDRLEINTKRFRSRMTDAGFTIAGADHPISPVMIGDARLASQIADDMLGLGIYVIGFSFPVVPKDKARIRVQLSAAHDLKQVDRAVDAFIKVGKKHSIIK